MIPGTTPGMDGMLLTIVMDTIAGIIGDGAGITVPDGDMAGLIPSIIITTIIPSIVVGVA